MAPLCWFATSRRLKAWLPVSDLPPPVVGGDSEAEEKRPSFCIATCSLGIDFLSEPGKENGPSGHPPAQPRYNTIMASAPPADPIAELLKRSKTIAVVGLSDNPLRPSHGVSAYMQAQGYRIIPVNPRITEALGEKAYSTLHDVPDRIDIVNIFRRSELVAEIVDEAIVLKVPAIWMQERVINEKAAAKARTAGAFVVMDRCILKEHKARFR